ncbi:hypothetical protein [Algoriphagus halophytocola]|uniref:T9SS type A sorting domain-containing protein n=1 Tax=Algoriphagus halophytocola TaxID=2991499 RepID=A0ABY6MFY2_9BACT|nr:hypothetical protein [Algoriphagus sp. TR-M5]UZD21865.1 hypothetical protein OM944_14455 [Algoriphagus sp. TR-M5]
MKNRILFVFLSFCFAQIFWGGDVWGQCVGCSSDKTYISKGSGTVINGNSDWTPSGKINNGSSILRFDGPNAIYHWEENDLRIGGVVLANGAKLSLDRGNQGNNPGFSIQGGCIVIGSGSSLSMVYITELRDVTICVEEGGSLIMDSREETRNDFTLNGVEINLQGPNSEIVIGEADFTIGSGGVNITGWTGDATDLCPTTVSGVAGSSGNISWTSDSDGSEICKFLNANAGCGPAGCDVVVNGNTITGTIQNGSTICIRGNRNNALDLQNRSDLTICVASGVTFSGFFTNYNTSNKIIVNVYGTVQGDLTLNNTLSSFNVFSGGQYNNYGTLNIQNGSASNQGTVSNSVIVSTNSTYFNSGTQSGQVTLNNSSVFTNNGTQSGQVIVNNSSTFTNSGNSSNSITLNNIGSYNNSGVQSGNVTMNHPNTNFSIASGGSQTGGVVTINDGSFVNNGSITRPVTISGTGSYINNNSHTGDLNVNGNSSVINNGTMNLTNLSFNTNNSGMSFSNSNVGRLIVANSTTMNGTIVLNGISTFNNNLSFTTDNGDVTVSVNDNAELTVLGTMSLSRNSYFYLTNPGNSSPSTSVIVRNLDFPNDGGASIRPLEVGSNTYFQVLDVANLQSGTSQLIIEGEFKTGTMFNPPGTECKNTLIVGNNGGGTPIRIQVKGDGLLDVTGSASVSKNISATENGIINISCNLLMENNGDNSFTIDDNVDLTVGGNTTLNKPMYVSGNAQITLEGNLRLPNVASELVINDDVIFYVGGNTSVESPIRMNDNAYVTFDGNVNLPNVGGAQFTVNENADILITSHLIKSGGNVSVGGTGQLVICDQRLPAGSISGSYPDASSSGISIDASPAYYGGCRILPVQFLSFNATFQAQDRSAILDWSTAKEWENSHFEIERAVNSVKEWETIGQVEGTGYSDIPVAYEFTDNELPESGGNIFYRLKQVDFSGKYSYSKTQAIQVEPEESGTAWTAYPNPSSTGSEIAVELTQIDQYHEEPITLRLANMLGEGQTLRLNSPKEVSETVTNWIRQKNKGLYILDIRWGSHAQQLKLLRH